MLKDGIEFLVLSPRLVVVDHEVDPPVRSDDPGEAEPPVLAELVFPRADVVRKILLQLLESAAKRGRDVRDAEVLLRRSEGHHLHLPRGGSQLPAPTD